MMIGGTVMRRAALLMFFLALGSGPAHAGSSLVGTVTTETGQALPAGQIEGGGHQP